jgi:predicted RNase H-like HicB family nuclease
MRYLIIIEKGEKNYGAYAPDLPGCITTGKTVEETKRNMREALGLHLAGMVAEGEKTPEPCCVADYVEAQATSDSDIFWVQEAKLAREKMKLSQPQFSKMLGVPVATLRNWEQGRTVPDGPGKALLRMAAQHPQEISKWLSPKAVASRFSR